MTEREAIEILSRPFSMQEVPKEILDAHRLAISALERQEQSRWHSVAKEEEPNLIIENLKAILEECTASEDAVSYVNSEDAGTLKAAIEALERQEQDRWIPVTEKGESDGSI